MVLFDYYSAGLGAFMGCIGLLVLLALVIGKAYNERPLYALAVMGMLCLAHLVLGGSNMPQSSDTDLLLWLSKLFYTTALAGSMLLPLLVLGQSGGSRRPAQFLCGLSACSVPVAMALSTELGVALGAIYTFIWLVYGVWYFERNWQHGKPWVVWLAGGQLMLWAAWLGKFASNLGMVGFDASALLLWSALQLMLFMLLSYLALVWRSRLLSLERHKSQEAPSHDPLTGLSLRGEFMQALERVSARSEAQSYTSGILVLRVKNLNEYSQSMGADNNELGLLWVARILRRCTRPHDMVARISDHHFAALIDGVEHGMDINSLATKIVSNGLRLQVVNPQGQALQFSIVAMPIAGKALQSSMVVADLLHKLDTNKDSDKAIHLINPDSAYKRTPGPDKRT
jgi:GGDEF domain-containing protein